MLASECVQHCDFIRSYGGLMTDLPHIAFEITLEIITLILGILLGRRPLRRFRRNVVAQTHAIVDAEHGLSPAHLAK